MVWARGATVNEKTGLWLWSTMKSEVSLKSSDKNYPASSYFVSHTRRIEGDLNNARSAIWFESNFSIRVKTHKYSERAERGYIPWAYVRHRREINKVQIAKSCISALGWKLCIEENVSGWLEQASAVLNIPQTNFTNTKWCHLWRKYAKYSTWPAFITSR